MLWLIIMEGKINIPTYLHTICQLCMHILIQEQGFYIFFLACVIPIELSTVKMTSNKIGKSTQTN